MDNNKIELLRDNINSIDDKILDLLKKRAEVVKEIGAHKKSKNKVVDIEREEKVLNRLLKNSQIDSQLPAHTLIEFIIHMPMTKIFTLVIGKP